MYIEFFQFHLNEQQTPGGCDTSEAGQGKQRMSEFGVELPFSGCSKRFSVGAL